MLTPNATFTSSSSLLHPTHALAAVVTALKYSLVHLASCFHPTTIHLGPDGDEVHAFLPSRAPERGGEEWPLEVMVVVGPQSATVAVKHRWGLNASVLPDGWDYADAETHAVVHASRFGVLVAGRSASAAGYAVSALGALMGAAPSLHADVPPRRDCSTPPRSAVLNAVSRRINVGEMIVFVPRMSSRGVLPYHDFPMVCVMTLFRSRRSLQY